MKQESDTEEFRELLIEMSREVAHVNSLYFRNISQPLEKLTSYNYKNLEHDISSGRIPPDDQFMYRTMWKMRNDPAFEKYRTNLRELVNYFKSSPRKPDDPLVDAYRKFLLDMADKVRMLEQ